MEPTSSVTDNSRYYVYDGRQQLSVGGCGVIEPGEVIGTSLGPLAGISFFLSASIHKVSPSPDIADASISFPHEGTETMQNNSAAFNEKLQQPSSRP